MSPLTNTLHSQQTPMPHTTLTLTTIIWIRTKGRRFESHRGQAYLSSLLGPVWIYTQSNITQHLIHLSTLHQHSKYYKKIVSNNQD